MLVRYLFPSASPTYLSVKACDLLASVCSPVRRRDSRSAEIKIHKNSIISTTSNVSPVSPDLTSDYWYLVLIKRKRRRLVIHILFFFQFKQMNVNPESGSQRIPKRRSSHYRERFHGYLWETVFRDQRYVLIVKRAVTPLYVLSLFSL